MTTDRNTFAGVKTPIYVVEEDLLRRNLQLIASVASRANVEIILAFKAFALWKTFPIFREYIHSTTASSLSEARLAVEEFGSLAHTFTPALTDDEVDEIARCSSHLSFNSFSQYHRYYDRVKQAQPKISCGIRINPEYSEIETMLYNPCAPGSRFGVVSSAMPDTLPEGIEGFHCHCHCESSAESFARTLYYIRERFGKWLPRLKWINFGGGHLMTRKDYNVDLLVEEMLKFHSQYPNLQIFLEPGSAFAWQTGPLVAEVVDIVEDHKIKTAILNVSFTCHMPDCLEMPYYPEVRGAEHVELERATEEHTYRLGGNSCLSGDFMGSWRFTHDLEIGEKVIFEDMIHYTTVKTTMFNGITHPSIGMLKTDGNLEILRQFGYEDYKNRMN